MAARAALQPRRADTAECQLDSLGPLGLSLGRVQGEASQGARSEQPPAEEPQAVLSPCPPRCPWLVPPPGMCVWRTSPARETNPSCARWKRWPGAAPSLLPGAVLGVLRLRAGLPELRTLRSAGSPGRAVQGTAPPSPGNRKPKQGWVTVCRSGLLPARVPCPVGTAQGAPRTFLAGSGSRRGLRPTPGPKIGPDLSPPRHFGFRRLTWRRHPPAGGTRRRHSTDAFASERGIPPDSAGSFILGNELGCRTSTFAAIGRIPDRAGKPP
ncbi:uncharacterized protein LOC114000532 [Pipra filicauda]|uniref:Uncharacterized protein LOC114000532 n=1 Tax=Pipra filicauda TaxID=649802 RepID=A0A7R5KA72_9PASS|nr:uncharacterized protein LOC114000532 [Pipra filicauda]